MLTSLRRSNCLYTETYNGNDNRIQISWGEDKNFGGSLTSARSGGHISDKVLSYIQSLTSETLGIKEDKWEPITDIEILE